MESIVCTSCAGTGEVMFLTNPNNPDDGSYDLEQCQTCGGVGQVEGHAFPVRTERPSERLDRWFRQHRRNNPIDHDKVRQAVVSKIEELFGRAR